MVERLTPTDSFDLDALRAGDRAEFARMVDATSAPVYRLALRMLGDAQDAEDVLQETYLKALRALPGFEGKSSLTTWLYRIAVNEALMHMRRRKPEAYSIDDARGADDDEELEEPQIVDWCCLPEQELLSAEARGFLDRAVQSLPDGLKAVFVLRDLQGLSIKETAEALNLSEMNVKTRLLRARLKLRQELSAYYGERIARSTSE